MKDKKCPKKYDCPYCQRGIETPKSFFELPGDEQQRIINKAAKAANEEQRKVTGSSWIGNTGEIKES